MTSFWILFGEPSTVTISIFQAPGDSQFFRLQVTIGDLTPEVKAGVAAKARVSAAVDGEILWLRDLTVGGLMIPLVWASLHTVTCFSHPVGGAVLPQCGENPVEVFGVPLFWAKASG